MKKGFGESLIYKENNPYYNEAVIPEGNLTDSNWHEQLVYFASKAFRKHQTTESISEVINYVEAFRKEQNATLEEAYKEGLKFILCSPRFLYLKEKETNLDSYEIASRLSYFLWSSPPSNNLLNKAKDGKLNTKKQILAEVNKMLTNRKSENFIKDFCSSWLHLFDLATLLPSKRGFWKFYELYIPELNAKETHLFFSHLLSKNVSIYDFLDSNYTFIDRRLSKFYGLKPLANYSRPVSLSEYAGKAPTTAFVKYTLPHNRRGGLLGHSSVLSASANGVDTSPIIRGAWVQEKLMNNPPPPPPENVSGLEPDTRGAKTLKEMVRKHTENESCATCHKKFDPIGFGLENYDAVGQWRDTNKGQRKIDSTEEYKGASFKNAAELRKALLKDKEIFARGFIKKMLMYSTGRKLNYMDDPQIDKIIDLVKPKNYRLRDIIYAICISDLFLQK